ncbi:MAG: DMT family transporter [Crocinitomicaceae bacterium]|nr:DMT family transporter [Crocinitomicaceae bacterium]
MWEKLKYQLTLHLIIFIWGFTAILGKWIDADAFVLVWFRVIIAFFSLLVFLIILRRNLIIQSCSNAWKTLGVGVLVALHWLTFYISIKESTASLAIICLATTTIHVSWLEPLVMKRKFLWSELVLGVLIIGGILVITGNTGEQNMIGIAFGLLSAILAASFSVFNAHLIQDVTASKITLYEMFSASIVMSLFLIFNPSFTLNNLLISSNDFYLLLFLGIICTSIAFLITVEITKFLGAFTVTLSINMEPIYTLGLAAWFLGEHQDLSIWFYVGASIIVGAVFGNAILKYQQRKRLKKAST